MGWFRRKEHDEEQLSAYLDGELTARQAENVERHLTVCDSCSALLEELRETRTLLSALPTEMPRRSFVLGAEHTRTPIKDVPPAKRFNLALAPAVALTVFVALLVVDLGNFSSTSSDESADTLTAATARELADDDATAGGAAGSVAGSQGFESSPAGLEAMGAESEATGAESADASAEPGVAAGSSESANTVDPEAPPSVLSAEAVPSPEEGPATLRTDGQTEEDGSTQIALDAPESDDDGGVSTLRILQLLAGAAFLASGFYVFVWPRLSRGGS